tara:strand:- start:438 stop:794 length:357 start_codon:yes stop_codon:yes gene_type:complete
MGIPGLTGTRLADIIFDRHEDFLYEDSRAMKLTPYVMSERCLQVEIASIYKEYKNGDYDTLTYILEGGFKGFHNMDSSELIEEYKQIEEMWYNLYETNDLEFEPYEEDPIHKLEEEKV